MCRYDEMNMKEGVCMSKKKKQHYIPRFLLKNFADQMPIPIRNGCIFRIDLEKGLYVHRRLNMNVLKNHFMNVERFYQKIIWKICSEDLKTNGQLF